jgi:hypothetical protein
MTFGPGWLIVDGILHAPPPISREKVNEGI